MVVLFVTAVFVGVACLVWTVLPDPTKRLIRKRILAEMSSEGEPVPWHEVALTRLAVLLAPLNRYLPTGWYNVHVWGLLQAAGLRLPPMHFLVLQELGAILGLIVYLVTMGAKHVNVGWLSFFLFIGFMVPYIWLGNRIQSRRQSVSRDLPEVVDLLALCVDAGLDFMQSLGRIIKEFRRCPTTEELGLVLQEVRVGKRRRDALRAFSKRVQTPETSSFSRTLVQADRMGTGMTEALKILSEDMRIQRYHWAERFAQQAPLKMLIPLLFSLASALVIVAGPILIQFLRGGFSVSAYTNQAASEGRAAPSKAPRR